MTDVTRLAARAAREAGVPANLYVSLITHGERSYKGWQRSPAGAEGPAQLMPGTAAGLARKYGIKTSTYYGNLLGGAYYLKEQLDHFKSPRLAVAAYNAGPGAVESHGGVPPYAETQRYVANVMGAAGHTAAPVAAHALSAPALPPAMSFAPAPLDMSAQIFQNLGDIATRRVSPLEALTSLTQSLSEAQPLTSAPPTFDLRGHPTTKAMKTPHPAGGWDGTYGPAMQLANLGIRDGLHITSTKRDRKLSSSGLPSDHWVGSKNAFAVDLSGAVDRMDAAAKRLATRLGIPYRGGALVATKTVGGLRYQLLYRTHVGGDHFTHIHVGVKRVG